MKRNWGAVLIVAALIAGGAVYAIFFGERSDALLIEELPGAVHDAKAALYFSTTADQDMNRDGLSYAVFIDGEGNTKLWEMDGLELGTVFYADGSIMLEDRNHIYIVSKSGTEQFKMEDEEHTGEVTAFADGMFYSAYNSGFTDGGGYASHIRKGSRSGFDTESLPYYMQMSGAADGELFFVAEEEDETLTLYRAPLKDNVEAEKVVSLGPAGDQLGLSQIVKNGSDYYFVMSDTAAMTSEVYRVNGESKDVQTYPFYTFADDEDYRLRVPYNLRNAAAFHDGVLYYTDGMGDIHALDLGKETYRQAFSLEGASRGSAKMNEQTYYSGGELYFFRYEPSLDSYAIDTYSLADGKKTDTMPVKDLQRMFDQAEKKRKKLSSYDFIMLNK